MAPAAYLVKEIFGPTLQGEGAHAGRPCVFLRFAVCNLGCTWCDTDFAAEGARSLDADAIAAELLARDRHGSRMVVVTGGEPSLQWDQPLATAVRGAGFRVHMESNGTKPLVGAVDWLTVSPKPQFHQGRFSLHRGLPVSEVKVVVDDTIDDQQLEVYEGLYRCDHWFLQPCAGPGYQASLARTIAMVERRSRWRLGLQLHKIINVP